MAKTTHEFQAETKELLNLMIHSIYTNHEIFLRELISNASDAIDKLHFESLQNRDILEGNEDYEIFLVPDKESHTLTISDNGIGMTKDEVVENIGTIAKSGTKAFLEQLQKAKENNAELTDKEMIGQFGVGFYSAFMVAEKVTITTRKAGTSEAVRWESTGDGSYTLEDCEKESRGTTITITLGKEFYGDEAEENFTDTWNLQNLVPLLYLGGLRAKIHQCPNGISCFSLGPCLQEFAQGDQCQDHGRRFKIEIMPIVLYNLHISLGKSVRHAKQCEHTINQRCQRSHSNQRIHIGSSVHQCFQSSGIINAVQVYYRQCQKELQQCCSHAVLYSLIPTRFRQANHMPHGKIHQDNQEHKRKNDAPFHVPQAIVLRLIGRNIGFFLCGNDQHIAGLGNCLRKSLCHILAGIHIHRAGKQVYFHAFHARDLAAYFFYTGGTSGTGHSRNPIMFLHGIASLSILSNTLTRKSSNLL